MDYAIALLKHETERLATKKDDLQNQINNMEETKRSVMRDMATLNAAIQKLQDSKKKLP